jgi:hypothetical protein
MEARPRPTEPRAHQLQVSALPPFGPRVHSTVLCTRYWHPGFCDVFNRSQKRSASEIKQPSASQWNLFSQNRIRVPARAALLPVPVASTSFCVSVDDRSHSSTIPALYTLQNGVHLNPLMRRLRGYLMTSYVAVPAAVTNRWPPACRAQRFVTRR